MRLTIAYSKIKKRNLVLINNDTYQRETLSERPIRQPLKSGIKRIKHKNRQDFFSDLSPRFWGSEFAHYNGNHLQMLIITLITCLVRCVTTHAHMCIY